MFVEYQGFYQETASSVYSVLYHLKTENNKGIVKNIGEMKDSKELE